MTKFIITNFIKFIITNYYYHNFFTMYSVLQV